MQEVFFATSIEKALPALKEELEKVFSQSENVMIKLHMGERGNKFFIRPAIVKAIADVMKQLGLEPFLFDSCTAYGDRTTAEEYHKISREHGFDFCPVKIGNEGIKVKTRNLVVEICKELLGADGMLVLSHVKGHPCCGFGGAIKNLGMGCVSKESKAAIHRLAKPIADRSRCIGCGVCAKLCPVSAISLSHLDRKPAINLGLCWGCDVCVINCPRHAIKPRKALIDRLLAEAAKAVLDHTKKVYFINWLGNIVKWCDCCEMPDKILLSDIGFVLGKNCVAVEKASFDLINQKAGKDFFKDVHNKSPLLHIGEAANLGIGKLEYKLTKV